MDSKLYTISEVADKLGIASKTLRRWEETGKFVGSRTLGGQRRYSLTDIQVLDAIKHGTIPSSSDLLTIEQAADLFGVSTTTIARWEEEGKIHPLITSGVTYYPRSRLLSKMEELKNQSSYSTTTFQEIEVKDDTAKSPLSPTPVKHPIEQKPKVGLVRQEFDKFDNSPILQLTANTLITIVLLLAYHLTLGGTKLESKNSPQGSVQGVETTRDASLTLLDSILDSKGHLTPTSVTSPTYTLVPSTKPPASTPGTIYFDTGSQSLKIFTSSWMDLTPTQGLKVAGSLALSGSAKVPNGSSSLSLEHPSITPASQIILTFTSDFAPAKKYWITKATGSFVLHTDFPVGADTSFDYLILNPETPAPSPNPEATSTPSAQILDSIVR